MGRLIDRIVHEDLPGDIGKARVESTCDEYAPIIQTNGHGIALQHQVLRHELLRPTVLGKVVLKDHLRVIRVTEEVVFRDWLHLVVEKFERMLVGELHDIVLKCANVLEKLGRHLRMK